MMSNLHLPRRIVVVCHQHGSRCAELLGMMACSRMQRRCIFALQQRRREPAGQDVGRQCCCVGETYRRSRSGSSDIFVPSKVWQEDIWCWSGSRVGTEMLHNHM